MSLVTKMDKALRLTVLESALGLHMWSLARFSDERLAEAVKEHPDLDPSWYGPADTGLYLKMQHLFGQALAKYGPIGHLCPDDLLQVAMTKRTSNPFVAVGAKLAQRIVQGKATPKTVAEDYHLAGWFYRKVSSVSAVACSRRAAVERWIPEPSAPELDLDLDLCGRVAAQVAEGIAATLPGKKASKVLRAWAARARHGELGTKGADLAVQAGILHAGATDREESTARVLVSKTLRKHLPQVYELAMAHPKMRQEHFRQEVALEFTSY